MSLFEIFAVSMKMVRSFVIYIFLMAFVENNFGTSNDELLHSNIV